MVVMGKIGTSILLNGVLRIACRSSQEFKVLFTEQNRLKQCTNGVNRQVMKSPVSPVNG